jgi:hypothetical protein
VSTAQVDAERAAKELEERVIVAAKAEAERLRASIGDEVAAAEKQIGSHKSKAIDVVVKTVTQV